MQTALARARANEDVDGERVAVWAFSAGGPLLLPIMAKSPPWLRCLAGTYPLLAHEHIPDWTPVEAALAGLGRRPFILTTVEHEMPDWVPGQAHFLAAARGSADLRHIEVSGAAHGFDAQTPTDQARAAVTRALDELAAALSS